MTSAQNGGRAHAGDLRRQIVDAMADTQGLQRHEPAPLRLIEPAEKEIVVMMKGLVLVAAFLTGKVGIRNGVQANECWLIPSQRPVT
jgi:hypothetical protein